MRLCNILKSSIMATMYSTDGQQQNSGREPTPTTFQQNSHKIQKNVRDKIQTRIPVNQKNRQLKIFTTPKNVTGYTFSRQYPSQKF